MKDRPAPPATSEAFRLLPILAVAAAMLVALWVIGFVFHLGIIG